ncbi:MAG: 16S rRNA (guanine(966)-N(2))-methyltransferase RsmD [Defluviitaleaceae bacterium]|nr:16S rRNA (guanine(966)-N(2))-methyltransferase RsmD [Defluviitaleaceae bacterium]
MIAPEGLNTRPTSDRAKESLFSILADRICGAKVLDIFCGSGAIGIEALSRGAEKAVFVDESVAAIKATQANLNKTRLTTNAKVLQMKFDKAIQTLEGQSFEIIFLDPPYGTHLLTQTLEKLTQIPLLVKNGIVIAETSTKENPEIPKEFTLESARMYGNTKFLFLSTEAK